MHVKFRFLATCVLFLGFVPGRLELCRADDGAFRAALLGFQGAWGVEENDEPAEVEMRRAIVEEYVRSPGPTVPAFTHLSLARFRELVVKRNEELQIQAVNVQLSNLNEIAESGVFEPDLVLSADHVDSKRENTVEEKRNLQGEDFFNENNNLYSTGIEWLSKSNGRLRVGYNLRDLRNNLQRTEKISQEFASFVGVNLTQPLLKNSGRVSAMARLRMAAVQSDIAQQEYRREAMDMIAKAEAAYWGFHYAQQDLAYREESLRTATTILEETVVAKATGRLSTVEVIQAESGVMERRIKLTNSRQALVEATNALRSFLSLAGEEVGGEVRVEDPPEPRDSPRDAEEAYAQAFENNPDFLAKLMEVKAQGIRLAFEKRNRLPQLDLKASYGLNGLSEDLGKSWIDLREQNQPAWSVAVEMRIPLGGKTERNRLKMAKLRKEQSIKSVSRHAHDLKLSIETASARIENALVSYRIFLAQQAMYAKLLEVQRESLIVGRSSPRQVLEVEEDLFDARAQALATKVDYHRAVLTWELACGITLKNRGLDSKPEKLEFISQRKK